jgi:hypothetical protein
MISQLSHEASADVTQLQIVAAIKLLKTNFNGNAGIDEISNIIALVNVMAVNYQSIHLIKNT